MLKESIDFLLFIKQLLEYGCLSLTSRQQDCYFPGGA